MLCSCSAGSLPHLVVDGSEHAGADPRGVLLCFLPAPVQPVDRQVVDGADESDGGQVLVGGGALECEPLRPGVGGQLGETAQERVLALFQFWGGAYGLDQDQACAPGSWVRWSVNCDSARSVSWSTSRSAVCSIVAVVRSSSCWASSS